MKGPQHEVTIAKPFAVGRFDVTFDEWQACVDAGGCTKSPDDRGWGKQKRPVIKCPVGNDAKEYTRLAVAPDRQSLTACSARRNGNMLHVPAPTPLIGGAATSARTTPIAAAAAASGTASRRRPAGSFAANAFGTLRHPRQRIQMGRGLLERQLYRGAGRRICVDNRWLRFSRPARRFVGQRSRVPPLRVPQQDLSRLPQQRHRFPGCQNALTSCLFTSLRLEIRSLGHRRGRKGISAEGGSEIFHVLRHVAPRHQEQALHRLAAFSVGASLARHGTVPIGVWSQ